MNFNYFVGVSDKSYDVTDALTPSLELVKRTIKQLISDIKFADDIETNTNKQDLFIPEKTMNTTVCFYFLKKFFNVESVYNNLFNFKSNLLAIFGSSIGAIVFAVLVSILLASLFRRLVLL